MAAAGVLGSVHVDLERMKPVRSVVLPVAPAGLVATGVGAPAH
jgi:hypothetical protein